MDLQEAFDAGFEAVKTYVDAEFDSIKAQMPSPDVLVAISKLGPDRVKEIEAMCEGIVPVIRDYIEACLNPLKKQIQELEARSVLEYAGVWDQKKVYGSGKFVTDNGSMWHSRRASVGERPGAGDAWQLAVKRGRDAK